MEHHSAQTLKFDWRSEAALDTHAIELVCAGRHGNAFAVLGPHAVGADRLSVRAFLPTALGVHLIAADGGREIGALELRHRDGFFEQSFDLRPDFRYRLRVQWSEQHELVIDDPYRFGAVLGDLDVWLLREGTHLRPYEILGANPRAMDGVAGVSFAVWAPNAACVSVIGDFNHWDGRRHPMRLRRECGVWELFLPGVGEGACYKYEIRA
ncbi:MAG: GlgB N-terminal domain-containing protein, partial [Rhodoferax sp.]